MGWQPEEYANAAMPTYPCLIDERHLVSELYDMPNVPMAVWIDEEGQIVRPAEPTGATDGFRRMDRSTYTMPKEATEEGRASRKRYNDALRDWIRNGAASKYALSADAARARVKGPSDADALASATFRLAQYLLECGEIERAARHFDEARRLVPDRWTYFRQALELQGTGKASGPEFAAAVAALGERSYYAPMDL
jgi:tetratricopeptide (TPR) repeat protein